MAGLLQSLSSFRSLTFISSPCPQLSPFSRACQWHQWAPSCNFKPSAVYHGGKKNQYEPCRTGFPLTFTKERENPIRIGHSTLLAMVASTTNGGSGSHRTYATADKTNTLDTIESVQGDVSLAWGHWVAADIILWKLDDKRMEEAAARGDGELKFYLHASRSASLSLSNMEGVQADDIVTVPLLLQPTGIPTAVLHKFPHLRGSTAFSLPQLLNIQDFVKCQLALSVINDKGRLVDATGVQLPGVLDELFACEDVLGPSIVRKLTRPPTGVTASANGTAAAPHQDVGKEEGTNEQGEAALAVSSGVTLRLWAPTAQAVFVLLYREPHGGEPLEKVEMVEEDGEGGRGRVWVARGPMTWEGLFYIFQVTVFHPSTRKIETCFSTDPYSRGLSANGERSLVVNLCDQSLKPDEWDDLHLQKPPLSSFSDIAIYELHIRDFSASDSSLPAHVRGGYLAFAAKGSSGLTHLEELAGCGLTHIHLLPSYDFGSEDERRETWQTVDEEKLRLLPPDSEQQQEEVAAIQNRDGYNWGYDPVHWGVPDGAYTSSPDGPVRTLEFRTMVQALNRVGLRVVLDVVYNHVYGSGPLSRHSVLDKVVPGYYLRRSINGYIENSTCMNNTASEHRMMERLIVDDIIMWAKQYKVDGFRFDLMGHLMKSTMERVRDSLRMLTVEKDGVDGSKIYLYGEGWDFGEIWNNGRGVNACQLNLQGTGIGSFNDRVRDMAMGGSPFSDPRQQGFLTGLLMQPNSLFQGDNQQQRRDLAIQTDWLCLSMAGNLRDFVFTNFEGKEVTGEEVRTHDGRPVAYAAEPYETINYVSAHDNETLHDIIMIKVAKEVTLEERCQMNHLATALVALSQGIPFFHAGDELLRSKSLDRDSYNSGDWFNRLDYSYETNNWGVGLPLHGKNGSKWGMMRELLADPTLRASKSQILAAKENFKLLLRLRFSSPLLHLPTANAIQARVEYLNVGPHAVPGVIVQSISDGDEGKPGLSQLDPRFRHIVVALNSSPASVSVEVPALRGLHLSLHPLLESSLLWESAEFSASKGSSLLKLPARSYSVFVEAR